MKIFTNTTKVSKAIFFGGLFSYDLIANFERLPNVIRTQKCPDLCFYLAETLLVLDHQKQQCLIQNSIFSQSIDEQNRIANRSKEINNILQKELRGITPKKSQVQTSVTSNMSDAAYSSIIKKLQKFIQKVIFFKWYPLENFFYHVIIRYQHIKN